MSEHTYPSSYPPEGHWALREAWAILDLVAPGTIPEDARAFLAGAIAGTLVRLMAARASPRADAPPDEVADLERRIREALAAQEAGDGRN